MALPAGCEVVVGGITARVSIDGVAKGNSLMGGGPWRDIVYQVDGDDSDDFMDALLGISISLGPPGSPISMPDPHRYPGNENLCALEVSGEPLTAVMPDGSKIVNAEKFNVRVRYGVPTFDVSGTQSDMAFGGQPMPWTRDTIRSFIQSYPLPKTSVEFPSGENPDQKFELRVPHIEFHRTRMMVPYLYLDTLISLVGKINHAPFWGYARGTLRVEPWDTGTEVVTDGTRVTTLDLTLTWRPYDWNMAPKSDGTWDYLELISSSNTPYTYADISPLFT